MAQMSHLQFVILSLMFSFMTFQKPIVTGNRFRAAQAHTRGKQPEDTSSGHSMPNRAGRVKRRSGQN